MPSAPSPTQTRLINSVYYAKSTPHGKSHDRGVRANVGSTTARDEENQLLLVQGPLGLNWQRRKAGVMPRVENADLTGANPPVKDRLQLWLDLGIHVAGRPEWVFAKLHTHGGISRNYDMLLGDPMRRFHDLLTSHYNDGQQFRLHYVAARELVNIVHAAEDGKEGNPGDYRDYRLRREGSGA